MIVAALQGAFRSAADFLRRIAGHPVRRASADRQYLEEELLPALARCPDVRRVLFVGCARYTSHYERIFEHAEYWTIDPVRRRRRWGAGRHIVDRLERVNRHLPAAYFDLIVCNGVLGWGLNRRSDAEAAFAACHAALRPGGELIVGWNDVQPRNAVRPDSLQALRRFERGTLGAGGSPQVRIDGSHRHVFEFYRNPVADGPQADSEVGSSGVGAHADSVLQAPSTHNS